MHWLKACPVRHSWVKPLSWPRIMCGAPPSGSSRCPSFEGSPSPVAPAPAPPKPPLPSGGAAAPAGCCSTAAISSTARLPAMAERPGRATVHCKHSSGAQTSG